MAGGYTPTLKKLESIDGRALPNYYVSRLRAIRDDKSALIATLTDQTAVETRRGVVRSQIAEMLSKFPAPGAVSANVTGTLARTGYTVEKLVYESLPDWWVSANLYVPDAAAVTPAPAVLVLCGHDGRGKHAYQAVAQGLAKLGFVSLIIDAIGMGERKVLASGSAPVAEHRTIGRQLPIVGWSMAALQAWDAMRGIDYLLSRAEVDDTHIGVTGTSGGGTQTVLVAALDDRVTMLAPSCFVTTFLRNLENELWADHEQVPPDVMGHGLDIDDFLLCRAPAPLLIIAQDGSASETGDFFDYRGVLEIHERCQAYWGEFSGVNLETDCRLFTDTNQHQLDADGMREAAQHFSDAAGFPGGTIAWPSTSNETESDLYAAGGDLFASVSDAKRSQDLLAELVTAAEAEQGEPSGETLTLRVREALRMPDYDSEAEDLTDESKRAAPPEFRVWQMTPDWTNLGVHAGQTITPPNYPKPYAVRYGVETEPGIVCPVYMLSATPWVARPPTVTAGTKAFLYVAHKSADQELSTPRREALITSTIAANPSTPFFAMDMRGVGELAPAASAVQSVNAAVAGDDFWAELANSLNEPLLGRMVWDILRAVDFLASYGYDDIHIIGVQWGAVPAALAALLDERVNDVTLKRTLTRWRACAVAEPTQMAWPESRLLRRSVGSFDLDHVYAELEATKDSFTSSTPVGAWGGTSGEET